MVMWVDRDNYCCVEYEEVLEYYNDGEYSKKDRCISGSVEIIEDIGFENCLEDVSEWEVNRYEYYVNGWNGSGDCSVEWIVLRIDGSSKMGVMWC